MLSDTFWDVYFCKYFTYAPQRDLPLDPAGGCALRPLQELYRWCLAPPHSHCGRGTPFPKKSSNWIYDSMDIFSENNIVNTDGDRHIMMYWRDKNV